MHFERITTPGHPLYAQAVALYKISFPHHEQREEASQVEILTNPAYHFDVVCDDGAFVGEILYWNVGEHLYIEHFCVAPAMRSKGYGARILAAMRDKPLILEIDPPVDEISRRRKAFYERCGFVINDYCHVHPPYHAGNAGHDLVVMSAPGPLAPQQYETFRRTLCDVVMANAWTQP